METLQRCRRCKLEKPAEAFYPSGHIWCIACNREYHKLRYAHAKKYGREWSYGAKYSGKRAVRAQVVNNFTAPCTKHDLAMLAIGERVVRDCKRPWFALQIITDLWAAMNKGT